MNWDDLRYVLAIARAGSLAGGARALGVDASTAYRRLETLESQGGVRLFDRERKGYQLTEAGNVLAELARRMEDEVVAAERRVRGLDLKLSGSIRVSTSEFLGFYLLPPLFHQFLERFPDVQIEVSVSDRLADLTRHDADVAIRDTYRPPDHLIGRRVSGMPFCAYVHRDSSGSVNRSLSEYTWISFAPSLSHNPLAIWLEKEIPLEKRRICFDSAAGVREALIKAVGAAVLPCFVGDQITDAIRITDVQNDPSFGLWVLTHRDLRRSVRVRTFTKWMGQAIAASAVLADPAPGRELSEIIAGE